jgi:hypothetical protein
VINPGICWTRQTIPIRQGAIQIMVGRPRKKGRREANGRIARTYVNPKAQVAAQPHRRGLDSEVREWPEAESEFGRLMLREVITPAQYEAGKLYAMLASSYRMVWGIPPIHPVSVDLVRVGASMARGLEAEAARRIKERYDAAFEACWEAGNKARRAVRDHAVFERKVDSFEALDHLRRGLDCLVAHFGIDSSLQISHVRNAK